MSNNRMRNFFAGSMAVMTTAALNASAGGNPGPGGGPSLPSIGSDRGPSTVNANRGGPGPSGSGKTADFSRSRDDSGTKIYVPGASGDGTVAVSGGTAGPSAQSDASGGAPQGSAIGTTQALPNANTMLDKSGTMQEVASYADKKAQFDRDAAQLPECK